MRSSRFRFFSVHSFPPKSHCPVYSLSILYIYKSHTSFKVQCFISSTNLSDIKFLSVTHFIMENSIALFLFYPFIICLSMHLFPTFQSDLRRLRYNWKSIPLLNFKHYSKHVYIYIFFNYNIIIIYR